MAADRGGEEGLDFSDVLKERVRGLQFPDIFRRDFSKTEQIATEAGISVPSWEELKKKNRGPSSVNARLAKLRATEMFQQAIQVEGVDKIRERKSPKKTGRQKSRVRGYSSQYRGVYRTHPTRRWEAQFRRNGKPTSLGCFDEEEQAARAYDRMMIWCELNKSKLTKTGIPNFDPEEYAADIEWLQEISQDDLLEHLRSEGRRQASKHRQKQPRRSSKREPSPELSGELEMKRGPQNG
eukprot:jgi/Picsp_1/5250/NSC_02612-R1_protein